MKDSHKTIALAVVGIGALLLTSSSNASNAAINAVDVPDGADIPTVADSPDVSQAQYDETGLNVNAHIDTPGLIDSLAIVSQTPVGDSVGAFLYMIRSCEHDESSVATNADYYTLAGGDTFQNDSDHPAATGEWFGKPLKDSLCRAAGINPPCKTTAAGAYQINLPTWNDFRARGGYLPDFSPDSQDECARRILASTGAIDLLQAGDIQTAILRASKRWASLPGSMAGQRTRSLAFALDKFNAAFG